MVRINTSPVFKSVNLDDAGSIRRVMAALDDYLTNRVLNNATPDLRVIQEAERFQERFVADIILFRIRMQPEYPLQQRALGAFSEQIYSSHTEAKLEELKKNLKPKSSKGFAAPAWSVASCKRCAQAKMKCTREEPTCWACRRDDLECQYPLLENSFPITVFTQRFTRYG